MIFTILRPSTATLRPNLYAVSIICCTRSTFDANVAIMIRAVLCSLKRLSNTCPTVRSDIVNPGRSAFVLSHINASTPFLPISANLCRSIASPNTGV